ncbi:autotransporter domain-containing protein [Microvirga alba]|uniref:Autotransporter domain-containing protein n=1 Tax=Microvirga alba TaxID=2791025 RepID=A0A931FQ49_9HYPH|nr:autotransporter serine protease [Microvirga alba]MBF9235475.1 autotransporter domain-containing protein [Microvirga alba]
MISSLRVSRTSGCRSVQARLLLTGLLAGTATIGLLAGPSKASAADASVHLPVFAQSVFSNGSYTTAASPAFYETDEYQRSWYLGKINAAEAYALGFTGKGVLVAVVDTGLDMGHPEFLGRISPLLRSFAVNEPPGFMSDLKENGEIEGHGTHVAGIIGAARDGVGTQGVAYNATILPLRAVEVANDGTHDPTVAALHYAAQSGAKVLNGSYGPDALPPRWIPDPASPGNYMQNPYHRVMSDKLIGGPNIETEYKAVKAAADADIVLVFSAGNAYQSQPIAASSPDGIGFLPFIRPGNTQAGVYKFITGGTDLNNPATYVYADPNDPHYASLDFSDLQGSLITVVATDRNNQIASYSNRCGVTFLWCLSAPGGDDARPGQNRAEYEILSTYPFSTYAPMVGTSMAAPVVAGGAAVLREAFPYMTARQIIEVILTTTDPIGPKEIYGRGLFNLGRAVRGPKEFGAEGFAPAFDVDTRGYDSTWSNDIVGSGGLIKRGAGNLVLAGANTYSGGTQVLGGALTLSGSVASAMTVGPAGILRGTGIVQAPLTVAGTLEPGAAAGSFGTLTVTGNATLLSSSIYRVDANNRGAHDKLVVGGTTTLAGGTLEVVLVDGLAPVGTPLEIISSAGGATGIFGTLRSNSVSAFLDPRLHYAGGSVTVSFERNTVSLADAATSSGDKNVAAAIDSLGALSKLEDALIRLDAASADRAFDLLSGEAHAWVASVAYGNAQLVQNSVLSRLRQPLTGSTLPLLAQGSYAAAYAADRPDKAPQPVAVAPSPVAPRYALWGEGFGAWGKTRSDGNAASLDASTGGFVLGADAEVSDGLRLGLAGGYTRTSFDVEARLSSGANESVFGALYGAGSWGNLSLRLGTSFAHHDFAVSRNVAFPGFAEALRASYDGSTVQAFGEVGYRIGLGRVAVEPFAGAAALRLHTDGFQEHGGEAALTGFGRTYELGTTTLGVRAEARLSDEVPLLLRGLVGWRHAYGDVEPAALLAFAGEVGSFAVSGVPVDRDALLAEAGLDWRASEAITLGVSYSGQIGSRAQEHALKGNFSWRF